MSLPWYTAGLYHGLRGCPGPIQEFDRGWTSEEDQHSTLLETYLLLSSNGTPQRVPARARPSLRPAGTTSWAVHSKGWSARRSARSDPDEIAENGVLPHGDLVRDDPHEVQRARVRAMYRRTSRLVFATPSRSVHDHRRPLESLEAQEGVADDGVGDPRVVQPATRSCVPTRRSRTGDLLITKGRRRLLGGSGGCSSLGRFGGYA
jgi:hypothetical protein